MSENIFGFSATDYFENPFKTKPGFGRDLVESGFEGLALGSPDFVPVDRRTSFPVVVMRVTENLDASLHLFKEFALIAALDTRTGKLDAEFLVEQKFAKVDREPVKHPPPPGKASDGGWADLFTRLEVPKSTGEYIVSAILLDRASNMKSVKVGHSNLESNPEGFAKEVREIPDQAETGIELAPVKGLVELAKSQYSPPLPKEPGVEIRIEKRRDEQGRDITMLFGSYSIPKPIQRRLQVAGSPDKEGVPFHRFTLLATGSKEPAPWLKDVAIPLPLQASSLAVEGYFSLRLDGFLTPQSGQTMHIYVFAGRHRSNRAGLTIK